MYHKVRHKTNHISFRRWSHKKWAVFCSLGQVVRIGILKKNIADRSLVKQIDCLLSNMHLPDVYEAEISLDDAFDDESVLINLQAILPAALACSDDIDVSKCFYCEEYYMPAL